MEAIEKNRQLQLKLPLLIAHRNFHQVSRTRALRVRSWKRDKHYFNVGPSGTARSKERKRRNDTDVSLKPDAELIIPN